ncbi:hypothetical protein ABVF11_02265 [Pediococcus argentinicus]|uniref:hypothetical protein n=1 Tax=Pediococcus argentinicus TaxID=480391 RepID=UPI00338D6C94
MINESKYQKSCKYCHKPFLDLSGKTSCEVDDDDSAYCGTDDYGNLEFGASFDSGCVNKNEYVKIKYCPMCGRKLEDKI